MASKRIQTVTRNAQSGKFVGVEPRRLSDPDMQPKIAALKQRISKDPAYAQSLLQGAGIVNAKGKLTRRFGG
jgi:hypothetical protein